MIYILEGLDCAGKTVRANLLNNYFISIGKKIKVYREPGGSAVGEELRKILKSDMSFSDITAAYLFATSRMQNLSEIIENYDEDCIYIFDRSFISSLVYQGDYAEKINSYYIEQLNKLDYTIIFIDIDYSEFLKRKNNRVDSDRFEDSLTESIFNSYRDKYKKIIEKYNYIVIQQNDDIIEKIKEQKKNQ